MRKFTFLASLLIAVPVGFAQDTVDDEKEPVLTEIITEAEGRPQNYLRYGSGYFPNMGMIYKYFEYTPPSPSMIIWGEGNKVYFRDLMDFGWDTFVEGEVNDNKITVKLPQTLFEETYSWIEEPYYNNLCVMTQIGEEDSPKFEEDPEITQITYTIDSEGNIILDPLPEGKAIGIMTYFIGKIYEEEGEEDKPAKLDEEDGEDSEGDDNDYTLGWLSAWSGAADFTQKFSPLSVELIEMPEDAEIITYYVVTNGYNYPIDVAFEGDYMYFKGFGDSPDLSNFVYKATIKDGKAIIPQDQYIGVFKYDNEMMVTKCGYLQGRNIILYDDGRDYELTIDKDKKVLTPVDDNVYLCIAYMLQIDGDTGQNGVLAYYNNFTIIYQDKFPGIPADPYNLYTDDPYFEKFGYQTFGFEITAFSNTGSILLTGNLYYSIYIDGELEEFAYDPDGVPYSHYYMLPEPTTEIPFLFDNDADIDIWTETEREIGYYYEEVSTLGVQAIYYYNDLRTESHLVTLDLETGEITYTGVATPVVEKKEIVRQEYYDLNGRKINNPDKGIFILKSIMNDGSVRSRKIAVK